MLFQGQYRLIVMDHCGVLLWPSAGPMLKIFPMEKTKITKSIETMECNNVLNKIFGGEENIYDLKKRHH